MNDPLPTADSSFLAPAAQELAVVNRLKAGDRGAFRELYQWYGDRLYREILRKLPNREAAEDCLKEALRKAMERIDQFEPRGASIFFWLKRIAVNLAMDHHRAEQRRRKLHQRIDLMESTAAKPPAPDRNLEVEDTQREVDLSLSKLNPRYAQVLRLRLIEERSREEAAQIMGVSLSNLDVLLHRACKAFRKVYPP